MYKAHPTHGAGTWPHRTQLKTAARKTTLNAGQCVRQPREGRGRNRQAPPPRKKKKEGGRGKGTKTAHSRQTARQQHHRRPSPPPEGKKKKRGTPTEAQGDHPPKTGNTKPVTADHGEKGHGKKKKESHQPSPKERGWRDRDHKAQKIKKKREKKKPKRKKKKKKQNTPRQPSQDGLGTGETRAQHTRPHRAPEPETAGGKRGAHETTHVPKAGRNRSPTTNTTNSRH